MAIFLRKIKTPPNRILLVRPDALGDLLQTLPAIEALSKQIHAHVAVLIHSRNVSLLEANSAVNQIITWDCPVAKNEIIQGKFDVVLSFYSSFPLPTTIKKALRTIPKRIGAIKNLAMLRQWNYPVLQSRSMNLKNEALYNAELLNAFTFIFDISIKKPRLIWQAGELEKQKEKFPFLEKKVFTIVMHYRFAGSSPTWLKQQYADTVYKLLLDGNRVVLVGFLEEEQQWHAELKLKYEKHFPEQIVDLTSKLKLRELASLMHFSQLYIGSSTGPTHLAASVGTPIIGIYSPLHVTTEIRWAPYLYEGTIFSPTVPCKPKYKCAGEACPYYYCMKLITAEQVRQAVQKRKKVG